MKQLLQIFGFAVAMLTASLASAQTTATFSIVEQDSLETAAPGSVRSPWRYSNDSTDLFRYVDGLGWVPAFDTLYSRNDSLFYVKFGTEKFAATISASGGVSDGDKGDITVASSGTSWTINNSTIGSGNIINGAVGWADLSTSVQDSIQAGGGAALLYIQHTADGTDTINWNSAQIGTCELDLSSVTRVPTLVFQNPVNGGQYTLFAKNGESDTLYHPANLLVANGDTVKVRKYFEGEMFSFIYSADGNYYTPAFPGGFLDTMSWYQINLSLSKSVSPTSVSVGDTVTFTIDIVNSSVSTTATGIEVSDYLPAGLINIHNISDSGVLNGTEDTITWTGISITAGQSEELTFDAEIGATDSYTNTAEITAHNEEDSSSGNDTDTATPVLALPVTSGLVFDLDADNLTTSGSAVTQWDDQSGNDRHFTPPTTDNRPSLVSSDINGHDAVDFDGTDDYLQMASESLHSGAYTVFAVVAAQDTSTNVYILDADDSSTPARIAQYVRVTDGNDFSAVAFNTVPTAFGASVANSATLNSYSYVTVTKGATNLTVRADGVAGTPTALSGTAATAAVQTTIGRRMNHTPPFDFADMKVTRLIFFNRELSGSEITDMETYLTTRYGL